MNSRKKQNKIALISSSIILTIAICVSIFFIIRDVKKGKLKLNKKNINTEQKKNTEDNVYNNSENEKGK